MDPLSAFTEPVTVIDLDDENFGIADSLVRLPDDRIRIGVATGPLRRRAKQLGPFLDVAVVPADAVDASWQVGASDPVACVAALRSSAEANPQAALILARVLQSADTDVFAALDRESFAYSTLLCGAEFASWLAARGPRPLPPPAAEPIRISRTGARLAITLNRPERRNAYGREVRDALVEALRLAVLDDGVTRVILDGTGPNFCSGGDLDEFGTASDAATAHFIRTLAGAGRLLHMLSDRLEVHVHGACVGAGIELPAFAGRVIARGDTVFRLPEVAMGLIPGAGGTVSIPRRIGRWRALFFALSGQPIDVVTALDWGLIDAIE